MDFHDICFFKIIFIIIFFILIFFFIKSILLDFIENNKNNDIYKRVISKEYLNKIQQLYPEEEIFKKTLELLEKKEKEYFSFMSKEDYEKKEKIEKELYQNYIDIKRII